MKTLRQLCAGLVLMLALTVTASAGQMDCPGVAVTSQPTAAGNIECPGLTDVLLIMLALI